MALVLEILFYFNGITLLTGGLIIAIISRNIIKMIIGFVLAHTGVNIILVSTGYIFNRMPPILNKFQQTNNPAAISVDPVPQALVLTSIVIGVATTSLFMFYALRYYRDNKTIDRDAMEEHND